MEVLQEKDETILKFGRKLTKKEISIIQSCLIHSKAVKGSLAKLSDIERFAENIKQETWERYKRGNLR
jgi:hypothetical protein